MLSSAFSNVSHIVPLSASEQTALFNFVQGGGCAILFPDNSTFGGLGTPAANESLIDPFAMDIAGTLGGGVSATVPDPSASPVTSGPFGTVSSFLQNFPGGLTNLGPFASPLATNPLGVALAVIESGAMNPGSGRVVVFTDVNMFGDSDAAGFFPSNQAMFLNTISFCAVLPVVIDVKPGSFPNSINLDSGGSVPVAIFSTANFDATSVDPTTLTLAGGEVRLRGNGTPMASFEDINGDGLLDLVVHVSTEALQLSDTDTIVILDGTTFDGTRIRGVDSIRIVP